jgi:hypothetical protein
MSKAVGSISVDTLCVQGAQVVKQANIQVTFHRYVKCTSRQVIGDGPNKFSLTCIYRIALCTSAEGYRYFDPNNSLQDCHAPHNAIINHNAYCQVIFAKLTYCAQLA